MPCPPRVESRRPAPSGEPCADRDAGRRRVLDCQSPHDGHAGGPEGPHYSRSAGLQACLPGNSDQNAKDPQKPKKKKKAKSDTPSPDEPIDPDAPEPAGGVRFVWKQHPSLRFGSVFRVDFEAKLQEDARWSYPNATGLKDPITGKEQTFQLHRNRFGVQGHVFKRIEYEVEHEFTEQELTEKDIAAGITPKSQWKDVNVNVTYVKNAQIRMGKFKIP
ncbi:MAG: hypothetical protein DMF91_01570, partial [Acidobacteria bacterium]